MFALLVIITLSGDAASAVNYVGCFQDTTSIEVPGFSISDKSLKNCIEVCMSEDYMFTCHLHNTMCYCGESFGDGWLPRGRCYAYCIETTAEECVGAYTDTVWYTAKRKEDSSSDSSDSDDILNSTNGDDTFEQQPSKNTANKQPRNAAAEKFPGAATVYYGTLYDFGFGGK